MKPYRLILSIVLSVSIMLIALVALVQHAEATPTPRSLFAAIWYVDAATGDDANDCLSPTTACLTVTVAIAKAADGDTILIAPGTYIGEVNVAKVLTISGAGSATTFLDGGHSTRVLVVSSAQFTVTNLTIQNGHATGDNAGGIYNFAGLTLDNVLVTHNTADQSGAGITNNGTLILLNSQIVSNTANSAGGGLMQWYSGVMTATNSVIADNIAVTGGGVYNLGYVSMGDTTLRDNIAQSQGGGGLAILSGTVSLDRVTVFNNRADAYYGGGILNNSGVLTLTNVTLSGNSASQFGGLANMSALAQTTLINSTISGNFIVEQWKFRRRRRQYRQRHPVDQEHDCCQQLSARLHRQSQLDVAGL